MAIQHLLIVIFSIVVLVVSALDVSFIPNDENAPLPLSNKYRESLRKLCAVLHKGGRLPAELNEKKAILEKMCDKLSKDDANVESVGRSRLSWDFRAVAVAVLGVGGGYVAWNNRHWLKARFGAGWTDKSSNDYVRPDIQARNDGLINVNTVNYVEDPAAVRRRIIEAREARLQKFSAINNVNAVE